MAKRGSVDQLHAVRRPPYASQHVCRHNRLVLEQKAIWVHAALLNAPVFAVSRKICTSLLCLKLTCLAR